MGYPENAHGSYHHDPNFRRSSKSNTKATGRRDRRYKRVTEMPVVITSRLVAGRLPMTSLAPKAVKFDHRVLNAGRPPARKCKYGHPMVDPNLYRPPGGQRRQCIQCRKDVQRRKKQNIGEFTLQSQLTQDRVLGFHREFKFIADRNFRFDFAWPDVKCAVEIDGGVFTAGRHTRPMGFLKDLEKFNLAVLAGWRVLHYSPSQVQLGDALKGIKQLLREYQI